MSRVPAEDGPEDGRVMDESGTISFVSAKIAEDEAAAGSKDTAAAKKPEKTWAQLQAERAALDQEMAREIAELGATPKGLRRARRWLDHLLVYGTAVVVAAVIYAIATMVWPSAESEDRTADVGVNDMVDEEVGSMMDARRRLMKGQQRSKPKDAE